MRGEIGIVAVRTATILHVSSPSFFSRYMQYTVSIAQNPASVKGERRFSARQCQRHRPPCPFLQRIRFLPADRSCPPGRNRTRRTEISINAYPCGWNPHFLPSFRAPAWRSARGICRFFARPFCKKADILRRSALPAAPAHPLLPAPQRLLVRPAFTPRPYPGSPPVLPYACPRRLRRRPPFVPPRATARPAHRLSPPAVSAAPPVPAADTAPAWAPCGANTAGSLRRKAA